MDPPRHTYPDGGRCKTLTCRETEPLVWNILPYIHLVDFYGKISR